MGEFKVWRGTAFLEASKGFEAFAAGYYLSSFEEDGKTYLLTVALIFGSQKEVLKNVLERDPTVKIIGREGDQMFFVSEARKDFVSVVLDKSVFFVKPFMVKDGFEYWHPAAWKKEKLSEFLAKANALENVRAELVSIKEEPLNLFLPNALSSLTPKQRDVLQKAYEEGYYDFPRKASLEEIAKKNGVPRTTFQNHLRKAENKLIPAVLEQLLF